MAAYCEYCGQLIETGARFCASCGAPVPAEQNVQDTTVSGQGATIVSGGGNYSVILTSLGTCTEAAAADLLEDTLGYSENESADLFEMLPAQIAQMLTRQQANYLAQAMTEYGMEVSVSNGSEYITIDETSDEQSVFEKSGSFLGKVLTVLGTITGLNRMRKFCRLDDPRLFAKPYRTRTYHPAPPVHVRRNVRKAAPQNPAPAAPRSSHLAQPSPKTGNMHGRPSHSQQNNPAHDRLQGHMPGPDGRHDANHSAGGPRHGDSGRAPHRH